MFGDRCGRNTSTLVYYFLLPENGIVGFPRSYRGPLSTRLDLLFPLQESRDGDWRHLFGIVLPLGGAQTSTSVETGDLLTVILRRSLSGMGKMESFEFGRFFMYRSNFSDCNCCFLGLHSRLPGLNDNRSILLSW